MDSLASSSFFLSHLATPPSFCLRSCRNICSRPFLCLVRSGFVWLLVLCGTPASFISRIKNHGGNSTADQVRQFSTVKIGCRNSFIVKTQFDIFSLLEWYLRAINLLNERSPAGIEAQKQKLYRLFDVIDKCTPLFSTPFDNFTIPPPTKKTSFPVALINEQSPSKFVKSIFLKYHTPLELS